MAQLRGCGGSLLLLLAVCSPVLAQDEHRIWGRVTTASGDVHEGFIRWDRNEGSWVDQLDGSKDVPDLNYQVWLAANDEERATRSIELLGYRVSWNESDPDFPSTSRSGIRFGHLASLEVLGTDRIEARLKSGQVVELFGGSTDIGASIREIIVDVPGADEVELDWDDLSEIDFAAPPTGARASAARLFGTTEDVFGRRFTGYVSWDLDEILTSDILDGDEMESRDEREVPFGEIESIERLDRGARVVLTNGRTLELRGSNDVDRGHRGVQISDPRLGMVEVEWSEFSRIRFHEPDQVAPYGAFDGGGALRGTVTTRSGEEIEGLVRWDADEASTWELIEGRSDDVFFSIELTFVDRIQRGEALGAIVTLRDGRTFELEDDEDVDWDNNGVLVAPEESDPDTAESWRLVPWEELLDVRFRREAAAAGREPGS